MVARVITGMKRLNVTLAILSVATCDIHATKTSVNNGVPSTRSFDKQSWWKNEKCAPRDVICFEIDGGDDDDDEDDDDDYFLRSREVIKSLRFSPSDTGTSRYMEATSDGESRYDASNSARPKRERCFKGNPMMPVSFGKGKLSRKKDRFASWCNSEKRYHRRQQGWKVQPPFYVEEPSWIEINNNYAERIMENHSYRDHLQTIDPFVITRGKKNHRNVILDDSGKLVNPMTKDKRSIDWDSRLERDENDDKIERNVVNDRDKRDADSDENDAVEKSWKKGSEGCIGESLFATRGKRMYEGKNNYLARKYFETDVNREDKYSMGTPLTTYRSEDGTISRPIYTALRKIFQLPIESNPVSRDTTRGIRDEKDNAVLFHVRAKSESNLANSDHGLSKDPRFIKGNERRNKRVAIPCNLIVRVAYYASRGKKADHRTNEKEILLGQRKPEESVPTTNSFIVGETLPKTRENNSKCDVTKGNGRFSETMKRTWLDRNLGDGMRGIFKDLLTRPDPFYVARGKRE